MIGTTKVDLSDYAKISQIPTKLSDLIQDIEYVTKYFKETNPTTLTGGVWKFNKRQAQDEILPMMDKVLFKDSLGNEYKNIGVRIIRISDFDGSGLKKDKIVYF